MAKQFGLNFRQRLQNVHHRTHTTPVADPLSHPMRTKSSSPRLQRLRRDGEHSLSSMTMLRKRAAVQLYRRSPTRLSNALIK